MTTRITPAVLDELVATLEERMRQAKTLGLHRTAAKLHDALHEVRSERHELPAPITVDFVIGPVRTQ